MPLPKHRKPVQKTTTEHNPYPLRLRVPSDGNQLEYLGHDTEKVIYVYTISKTKQGMQLPLTIEQFRLFMRFATDVAKIDL